MTVGVGEGVGLTVSGAVGGDGRVGADPQEGAQSSAELLVRLVWFEPSASIT